MNAARKSPKSANGTHARSGPSVTLAQVEKTLGLTVAQAHERYARLTARQRQVAGLMARGLSNRRIAEELEISPKTGDIHRADVYDKLGVTTSAGVARIVYLVELAAVGSGAR